MTDYVFVLQPGQETVAGGGAFIASLMAALRAAGHGVQAQDRMPAIASRTTVVDGLMLRQLTPAQVEGSVGLVHHLTALTPAHDKAAVAAAERACLLRMRCVVATNAAAALALQDDVGLPAERIVTVLPGVPDAPRSVGSHVGCDILSVGALVPRKGHDVLIDALTRLHDLDWQLTIVGDSARDMAHAAVLRALAERMPGRVHFAGPLDPAALEAAWQRADLFALATRWEGYAAPVAEALRRGVPVAVTAGGAAAEHVTPQRGIVCEPGDVVQFSKSIRRLVFDAGLRAAMAQAAWQAGQALPNWAAQAAAFAAATR